MNRAIAKILASWIPSERYRKAVRRTLCEIPSKRVLVLDQLCSANLPPEEFAKYIGPFKMIPVYRDPRDVFCTGAERCMPWIPNEPKAFVKWFSSLGIDSLRDSRSPFVMTLRFEDLVLDYDRSVKKIEEFVGLSPERHDRPRSAFDPARSKANIGLWKKWPDRRAMVLSAANLRDTAMTDRKDHCDKDMPL